MRVKRAAQETAKIQLSTDNPVFATYAIAAALAVLKIMGLVTVCRMMKSSSGLSSPEHLQRGLLNKSPNPDPLSVNDYVDRSRRMHRNNLETFQHFWRWG